MCGIAGKVSAAPVREDDIRRMTDRLHHRGPDDTGLFIGPGVGLGHRRLSIIDLHTGHQPICNEDGTVWIVFNGEIYNYKELRADLLKRGHRFRTETDTEVIAHLYEEFGQDCVKHLRGMFAFAIWDEPRRRLFAARDHLGQKPFFYVHRPDTFFFASEIKALLAADRSLAALNPAALDQYLCLRVIAPPLSMFQSIRKLPPAHSLTFNLDTGLAITRYWDLQYEPKLAGSDDELADELESQLVEALKLHMVSDVPVGAFLSGGLDSTLIVALLMHHRLADPIQTFSMGLPYGQYNEAPYARMVAEQYGTRHVEKTVTPSMTDVLPTLVWHLDEPSDPLSLCSYLIAALAREHVKVVLGGDGGDELFGGYDRYYGNRYAGYYSVLPEALRRYGIGTLLKLMPDGRWYKSAGHQLKWLHRLSFLDGGARYARSLGYFYFGAQLRRHLYGPQMQVLQDTFDPERDIREAFERSPATDPVDRMLYADNQIRLPDHSAMILDRMTMAHGLEARSPFMDHKVAEFAARLPMRLKVRGRSLRYIQKLLAKRYLPKPLLNLRKQGFSVALPYMLRDQYRVLFRVFLKDSHLAAAGIFRQDAIDDLLSDHLTGNADHGNRLWLLLNSEAWYRMHIEGTGVEDMSEEIRESMSIARGGAQKEQETLRVHSSV
jgi:asparagine synthase (glutamine-hydrolysing)